jgi:hypothetical protein
MEYLCYSGKKDFLFKNIKIPMPYFHKILNDYFEDSEINAYEKKLLTGISKVSVTPYMEHIFAEVKDFTQYRGGLGLFLLARGAARRWLFCWCRHWLRRGWRLWRRSRKPEPIRSLFSRRRIFVKRDRYAVQPQQVDIVARCILYPINV